MMASTSAAVGHCRNRNCCFHKALIRAERMVDVCVLFRIEEVGFGGYPPVFFCWVSARKWGGAVMQEMQGAGLGADTVHAAQVGAQAAGVQ